jgi:hypothetical protein
MNLKISRVGEPTLVSNFNTESVKVQNVYKIATTPLPADPRRSNWIMLFDKQLKGPLLAWHDGNEITVYCNPDEYPDWLELVDAAIEKANEEEGTIQYEGNV